MLEQLTALSPCPSLPEMAEETISPAGSAASLSAAWDRPDKGNVANADDRALRSTQTKLLYGFGSIAFGVKDNGFATFAMLFYNQVIGLPAQLVSAVIMIALIFDAFIDPVVGAWSDNLRSRWGRRHPFMYLSALPVAVSYLLLWNPPHWSQGGILAYLLVCAVIVRTFITFYEIPSSALVAELTEDYDQRTVFLAYRYFFGWFGGLGMSILAYAVLLEPDATHKFGQLNPVGNSRNGMVAGAVMFVAILVSSWGTHKFIPRFHVPQRRRLSFGKMMAEMLATMWNRSFLVLTVAGIFFYVATGLVFSLNQYFATYFWELSANQIALFSLLGLFAAAFAFVLALPLSKLFGKKWAAIGLFVGALFIGCAPLTLRLIGRFPPNGAPVLLPLLLFFATLSLMMMVASSVLLASMLADVVEDSQIVTQRRSEGVFFAGNSFMQKMASGLGLFVSGLLLWAVGFPTRAVPGHTDPRVVGQLAIVYIVALVVLYGIALALVGFYRISRADHEENLRRLAAEVTRAAPPLN